MTNLKNYAMEEFALMRQKSSDSVVLEFEEEILALCEKFGNSGQSNNSASFFAGEISNSIHKLLMFEPLLPITGEEDEWFRCSTDCLQNKRCSALFKDNDEQRAHYLVAIIWKGKEKYDTFVGTVYIDDDNFETINSCQFVKFPFTPKTFYVDVERISIQEDVAKTRNIYYFKDNDGSCYYYKVKDMRQLEEVFKYYEKK